MNTAIAGVAASSPCSQTSGSLNCGTNTITGGIAIGQGATANPNPAVAIGVNAQANASSSVAIGTNATTTAGARGSVALGSNSIATRSNSVEVGGRQITGLAEGTAPTDAVNVRQMNRGVATALAVPPTVMPGVGKQTVAIASGTYGGEYALGLTYSYQPTDDVVVGVAASGVPGGDHVGGRAFAAYSW